MATAKQMDYATTLAREYARLRERGEPGARLVQIRGTINDLVARYDGEGSIVLPQSIEQIMGVDAYGTELASSKRGVRREAV